MITFSPAWHTEPQCIALTSQRKTVLSLACDGFMHQATQPLQCKVTEECTDRSYQVAPLCPGAWPASRGVTLPWHPRPQRGEGNNTLLLWCQSGWAQRMRQWRERHKHLDGVEPNRNAAERRWLRSTCWIWNLNIEEQSQPVHKVPLQWKHCRTKPWWLDNKR